ALVHRCCDRRRRAARRRMDAADVCASPCSSVRKKAARSVGAHPGVRPAAHDPVPCRGDAACAAGALLTLSTRAEGARSMNVERALLRAGTLLAATAGGLVFAASALAHAEMSPSVALAKNLQLFSLAVPTEKEKATTTKVELTPPSGFSIDSFVPAPGWTREAQTTGTGENTTIEKVMWSGGKVPT